MKTRRIVVAGHRPPRLGGYSADTDAALACKGVEIVNVWDRWESR